MPKLTTQAGSISLGRGVAALAALATAMVLSRLLSKHDYGTYRQVWLLFYALAPILELGIPPSVSFFAPRLHREEIKTYLVQNSLVLLLSGSLLSLAFFSLAEPLARLFGNPDVAAPLAAFSLFPALALPFHLTENSLAALGRGNAAGAVSGVGALLQSGIILALVLSGESLSRIFLFLSLWALLRWGIAFASLLYLSRQLRVSWSWKALRLQLRFAMPIGAAALAGILARQLDRVIVSSSFSTEQFALYANGSYEIPLIGVLTLSVTAVLVPAIVRARAKDDTAEIKRLWHGAARRLAWLFFPAFTFLLVAARPLMILLFSEQYAGSAAPFRVFLFLLPLRIALYGAFLRALGRSRPILVASLGSLTISLVLALVLVRIESLGFLGPAIAATVASYWAAWYAVRAALRTLGWSLREYFPWKALAAIMGVALAAAVPVALLGWLLRSAAAPVQLAVMGGAFAGLYLLLGEATRGARPREWVQAIGDFLKQR